MVESKANGTPTGTGVSGTCPWRRPIEEIPQRIDARLILEVEIQEGRARRGIKHANGEGETGGDPPGKCGAPTRDLNEAPVQCVVFLGLAEDLSGIREKPDDH